MVKYFLYGRKAREAEKELSNGKGYSYDLDSSTETLVIRRSRKDSELEETVSRLAKKYNLNVA